MARKATRRKVRYDGIDAVDLFCGGGGLTCGLQQAGINVQMGIDFDGHCKYAYEHNNKARFLESSVRVVKGTQLSPCYRTGRIKMLAGCAPCQTFSKYNQKVSHRDGRWSLLAQFKRLITEVRPELVTMENVPALIETGVFDKFVTRLEELDYNYDFKVIKCNEYGMSQLRQRVVLIASQFAPIQVPPPPTNVHVKTVREIIGDLPELEAGKCDPNDRLHFCAALSPLNMRRIRASRQGGTWRDWPRELVAECHRKDTGKTYGGVYGRMSWDKPAPTMTTQFYGFGNGRFGHPEQNRAISIREGAMFQGFPRDYQFVPEGEHANISLLGKMIGNAVPVQLGKLIGETFITHLKQLDLLRENADGQ
jgi:DNA (cytosine-5)-methyltransferase 1